MYLFGEKEGIFQEVCYVEKDGEMLLFDTEQEAEEYRRGRKKWHVVPHNEDQPMSDMPIEEFVYKFIKHCETYEVEFDEELLYNLVEKRYGSSMIPLVKMHVFALQNDH